MMALAWEWVGIYWTWCPPPFSASQLVAPALLGLSKAHTSFAH